VGNTIRPELENFLFTKILLEREAPIYTTSITITIALQDYLVSFSVVITMVKFQDIIELLMKGTWVFMASQSASLTLSMHFHSHILVPFPR
jgi:hypothetical protein